MNVADGASDGGEGAGAGGLGGAVTHAASKAASATASARRNGAAMEWIILEALVALALGLVIVWWTLSAARKRDRGDVGESARKSSGVVDAGGDAEDSR